MSRNLTALLQTALPLLAAILGTTADLTEAQLGSLALLVIAGYNLIRQRQLVPEAADLFRTSIFWAQAIGGLIGALNVILPAIFGTTITGPSWIPLLAQFLAVLFGELVTGRETEQMTKTLVRVRQGQPWR